MAGEIKSSWREAIEHATMVEAFYMDDRCATEAIERARILNDVIGPLLVRYQSGERTPELYEALLAVE
jgi:hypothetical protein